MIGKSEVLDMYENIDLRITGFLDTHGLNILRYGIAIVFIWFGALKPFGLSPANELVIATTSWIFDPDIFIPILGVWEVLIGIGFLFKRLQRAAIFLLALQMGGTFLPIILLPDQVFTIFPYALTLEGQYIIKNLVIIGGAMVIGSKVREVDRKETRILSEQE